MAEPMMNIVLVGRTGNGKSATGNTLLGQKLFNSRIKAGGVTMECEMFRAAMQDGPIINVIDTPGLFDLSVSSDYIKKEITKCLTMAEEGIHAVLFILSTKNRISQEEESTFYSLQHIFNSKIVDYIIVVFTGGDKLQEDGQTLDDYLRDGCPEFMTRIFRLCRERKILFDNKTTNNDTKAAQLKQLMSHVADVKKQTGGKPYTLNWHHKIKDENDKLKEKEIKSKYITEAEATRMMESLRIPHEETMRMMAHMVENTLKQNAEAHEREMRELKEQMKQGHQQNQQNQLLAQMENTLKQNAEAHEREMRELKEEIKQGQRQVQWNPMMFPSPQQKILKCMVYARDLGITWSDNSNYWSWLPIQYEASEVPVEVAVLEKVCWLEVNGKFDTSELTRNIKYEVVFVVKLNDKAYGWDTHVNLKLKLPNDRAMPQERSVSLKEHIGKWWVDIPAGEFMMSSVNSGEISFSMYETVSGSWKRGLIVKGVAIRPKN